MSGPDDDREGVFINMPPADRWEDRTPTTRDTARRHWLELADPDRPPSAEALAWVRGVALRMIAADVNSSTAADRREAIFEASGLKGDAYDGSLPVLLVALRDYERLRRDGAPEVRGVRAVEFIAKAFEWDEGHEVAPDSHKRRILRALERLNDPAELAWARSILALK